MHFLLTAHIGISYKIHYFVLNSCWQSLSFQLISTALLILICITVYFYRLHAINKKSKQLFELNTRLMLEINERRKAEKDLLASKKRFNQLSQATFEALFITDKNKIREINQSASDMFGYSRDEFMGMPVQRLLTPLHKKVIKDLFKDRTSAHGATAIRKDCSVFFAEIRAKDFDYENEKFKVLAISDITDKVEADKQKEVLEQQLRHAQKMEAVGKLAGGVAHDFNNMLQVIMGFSEMAAKKLDKSDPASNDISQIMVTTEKAAYLTRQLMTFSKRQTYQPQVININNLIINLQNILSGLLDPNIKIEKKLEKDVPNIFADPGQIEQVLVNLLVNAQDAVNEKKNGSAKKIVIKTGKAIFNDALLTSHIDMSPVDHICIEIKDNGCGIPDEIKQRVYEPFFTTKPEGKGTGLGLSTVYGIIKQNKAVIDFYSELAIGTTFKILWPATDKKAKEKNKKTSNPLETSGNESILLVEDEEGIRNFAGLSLQQSGYNVFYAENGIKALQMIEDENIDFDLLISDLNMPGMDGDELLKILHKKKANLKAVIMSGYGDESLSTRNSVNGKIDFLQKPFSIKSLLQKVRTTLDRN